ncbi:MAG TPA: sigma-70 family RNA polymerase sigma factor [Thermoleophilaceae bacterium]|nr:sigma-70 family RNA polymerase sigma factor [Thermoleophilaceae bacterium]
MDLVRAGSDPAFEAIVERYRRALMRYVSRLLPPERAEDVVQQAFVKAYEAMRRDAAELNLKPWLYRIAHNGALNALRDRALVHAELDERIDGVERPEQALERALGLHELVVAVKALPERQRHAILLRELEGRSYEEIATALGVTDGAVRQLLNRARNSLRSAAAALTPMPLVTRLAAGESTEPVTARVAELIGVGGSALAMKLCATALVTTAVVGGAAIVPDGEREQSRGAPLGGAAAEAADDADESSESGTGGRGGGTARANRRSGSGESSRSGAGAGERGDEGGRIEDGSGNDDGGHSGPGGREDDRHSSPDGDDDGHSGPGGGGLAGDPVDNSGPGGGGELEESAGEPVEASEDRSGSGGGDSSGSGGGTSGSGASTEPMAGDPAELDNSGPG